MRATEPRRTAGAQQQEMKQTRHHQRRSRLPAQAFQNLRQGLLRAVLGLDTHVCLSDAVASTTPGSNPNLKLPRTPSLHSKRPSALLCACVVHQARCFLCRVRQATAEDAVGDAAAELRCEGLERQRQGQEQGHVISKLGCFVWSARSIDESTSSQLGCAWQQPLRPKHRR